MRKIPFAFAKDIAKMKIWKRLLTKITAIFFTEPRNLEVFIGQLPKATIEMELILLKVNLVIG